MNIRPRKSQVPAVILALIFILGASGISWGAEFWLRAQSFTKTMPDTGEVVTMWGFAQCSDGSYGSCSAPTVPGPRLTVPPGDATLTINLRNNLTGLLTEPVSIVIPGQTATMAPVKFTDGAGRQRVKSFTTETPADNSTTVAYSWSNLKPGTYLYQSGSHPALQVQMGLYGALTKDAAAGQAYGPTTAYQAETLLLFSEIDPVLHGHVAAGSYGTPAYPSTIDYQPRYFLINGEPYSAAVPPIAAAAQGQNLLIRFLSASLKYRAPTVPGLYLDLVAEDGYPYAYPKRQYSLLLPPGKTLDALVPAVPAGSFPIFDRRLGLTNDSAPGGGMLRILSVSTDTSPPSGSVLINGGAAATRSRVVALTLSASDLENTVTGMRFSWNGTTWYGWESYATTRNASIPEGADGEKTIYVQFRDAAGNVSSAYSDSIVLDRTGPTGSVVINGDAASSSIRPVVLTLSATDANSTVTNMRFSWNGTTWYGWESYATTRNATLPLGAGVKTIRVQFRDALGNVSAPFSDSITYAP